MYLYDFASVLRISIIEESYRDGMYKSNSISYSVILNLNQFQRVLKKLKKTQRTKHVIEIKGWVDPALR